MKIKIFLKLFLITIFAAVFSGMSAGPVLAQLNVVTSVPDLANIATHVGGDKVKVTSIASGYQDPHYVEPKPSFMILLKKADLYLVMGMDMEVGWSPPLEQGSGNPAIMKGGKDYIDCSRGIRPQELPQMKVDRSMGDVHPCGNPHYLMDPQNGIIVAETVEKALSAKDPKNADYYRKRKADFIQKARKSQIVWLKRMLPHKGLKVVTYHKNWTYFANRFGMEVVGYIEPKPGISPSPAHMAKLISLMKQHDVKIIIRAPHFESKMPEMAARSTGARVLTLPVLMGGVPGTDDYFSFFDYLTSAIADAASKAGK